MQPGLAPRRSTPPLPGAREGRAAADAALRYQEQALQRVSRTFALTIPQLPAPLRGVVGNAYLLCRIADTIEDEPGLAASRKREYLHRFADVVGGDAIVEPFAADLAACLSDATPDGERDLVANAPLVVGFQRELPSGQRDAVERCVTQMCHGMAEFVGTGAEGLRGMVEVDRYCHYVAGVVGEMITDLLCDYSAEIAARRGALFPLSSRFGRGLQLVNILKDHQEDLARGVSWLPRDCPHPDAEPFPGVAGGPARARRIARLAAEARRHLDAALRFALLVPREERGIRRFLLWTLGFAALTLRRIDANPRFDRGDDVKIPRRQVYAAIAATSLAVRHDNALRWLFDLAAPSPACAPADR